MPKLGKGTECIKILLSQVSKNMHEPLISMLFPPFGAHNSGAEFQYPDNNWKDFVVKWPISWPIRGVTRANCPIL